VTKEKINKRGYNKFLEISDDITVGINYEKVNDDQRWDGWKGYMTNTDLFVEIVYQQYKNLLQVERAFRVMEGIGDNIVSFKINAGTEKRME